MNGKAIHAAVRSGGIREADTFCRLPQEEDCGPLLLISAARRK